LEGYRLSLLRCGDLSRAISWAWGREEKGRDSPCSEILEGEEREKKNMGEKSELQSVNWHSQHDKKLLSQDSSGKPVGTQGRPGGRS